MLKNSEFDQIIYSDFMSGKAQLLKYQETGRNLSKRSESNRASAVIYYSIHHYIAARISLCAYLC